MFDFEFALVPVFQTEATTTAIYKSVLLCFICALLWLLSSLADNKDKILSDYGFTRYLSQKNRWGKVHRFSDNFSYSLSVQKKLFFWSLSSKWTLPNDEYEINKNFLTFRSMTNYIKAEKLDKIIQGTQILSNEQPWNSMKQ